MTMIFNLALLLYLGALLLAVLHLVRSRSSLAPVETAFLALGALAQTLYIGQRWLEAGRAPFSNMFESLVLFAWSIVGVYLVLNLRLRRIPGLGAATALLALLVLAYASTFESEIRPLMPALRSNWLSFHVFTCFLGYAGFAVSFLAAIVYLVVSRKASTVTEDLRKPLEAAVAKSVAFGFLFLTIGIITGAVWANSAWGTYWSWDPKETWSLITWLIYAFFLHCRFMRNWRGRVAAWISILGFLSVIFTYVGVNLLMKGLHSYA